ncbi:TonB-dependent receptor [Desulfovibrio sp. UCD-KL4C]|uniref:TonB-dependent receptor n=1 Tax=Desulfovibrio sp. UCD-KL4C TaxID=2578120 RepID=UPI0025BBC727|nr:TonB-dependent receptor [Desulfovibrio sp. UCD-KL4C]
MHKIIVLCRILNFLLIFVTFLGANAFAHNSTEAAHYLPLVTVKSQKRTEKVQEVPVSVVALDEIAIKDMDIKNTDDLSFHVPNLEFNDFGSRRHGFMFLRGVKSLPTGEPSIGYYVDGVSYSKPYMFNFPLFDVEQIEVLRGAQGTLYGRNTIGGVINVYTQQPGNEVRSSFGGELGNFHSKEFRASWSGPIVEDKLFLGVYGLGAFKDGYMENDISTDGDDGRHQDGKSGRVKLRYLPAEDLDMSFSFDIQNHDDGAYAMRRTERNAMVQAGKLSADKPYHYSHDYEGSQKNDCWGLSLNSEYKTKYGKLYSITGYRFFDSDEKLDSDFSPLDQMRKNYLQQDKDFSQEFRFTSLEDEEVVKWLAGAYFFLLESDTDITNLYGTSSSSPGEKLRFKTDKKNVGSALFGQGTYTFGKNFDLTMGLRYEYEYAGAGSSKFQTPAGSSEKLLVDRDASNSFSKLLPKVSLAWHVTKDRTLYGTVSRASRSGGFNDASAPADHQSYDEEDSWLYEVGLKSSLFDNRLNLNLSGFYTSIDDEQLSLFQADSMQSYTANAGSSHRLGVEVESKFMVMPGLNFSGSFTWMQAEFDKYSPSTGVDYKGNRVFGVPDYTYTLAADYRRNLAGEWGVFSRIDLLGIGSRFFDDGNTVKENPYELVNLKVGVEGKHLDVYLWSKNILDRQYVMMENTAAGVAEDGAPRTFGISIDYRF